MEAGTEAVLGTIHRIVLTPNLSLCSTRSFFSRAFHHTDISPPPIKPLATSTETVALANPCFRNNVTGDGIGARTCARAGIDINSKVQQPPKVAAPSFHTYRVKGGA